MSLPRLLPLLLLACLLAAPAARADRVERTITARGETVFIVPEGVTSVQIIATGEAGGTGFTRVRSLVEPTGGRGARVQGTLAVSPGQRLFVQVGVGGGSGGTVPPFSGAGGGASDVRLCPAVLPAGGCDAVPGTSGSIFTRVLVAGGGGGAGANLSVGITDVAVGGDGGDAGTLKVAAQAGQSFGQRLGGGGALTLSGGGGGAAAGSGTGETGIEGQGGAGGQGFLQVQGAGGGGGRFGGGGSASSDNLQGGPTAGGGGGSSFANETAFSLATVPSTVTNVDSALVARDVPPSVTLAYNDAIAPRVAVTSPGVGQVVGARPTIRGTAGRLLGDLPDATVILSGPGGARLVLTSPIAADGTFAVTPAAPLAGGAWTATAEQRDDGGNRGTTTRAFTVDALAPVLALTAPTDSAFVNTPALRVRGVAGTKPKDTPSVRVLVTGPGGAQAAALDTPVGAGGAFDATTATLRDGRYSVTATQRDDGQAETTTPPVSVLIDTVAPTIDIPFLDGTEVGLGATLGLFYTCADAGAGIAACDGPRPSGAPVPTSAPGVFTDTITATDRAQNVTTRSITYTVRAPVAAGAPTGAAASQRRSPGLVLRSVRAAPARNGRVRLTVRGATSAAAIGQRLTVTARKGRRTVRARTTLRTTTWRVTLRLPVGAGRWTVAASLPGGATLLPATARRTVRLR